MQLCSLLLHDFIFGTESYCKVARLIADLSAILAFALGFLVDVKFGDITFQNLSFIDRAVDQNVLGSLKAFAVL